MNLPLFRYLVGRYWLLLLLCALTPIGIGLAMGWVYPLILKERAAILPFLKFVKRQFADIPDFSSPSGAFVWPFIHPLVLLFMTLAPALPMLGLPAKERGRGGLDLLLATPLERGELIRTLLVFLIPVSGFIALSPLLGSLGGAALADVLSKVPLSDYLLVTLAGWLFSMAVGAFALMISSVARDSAQSATVFTSVLTLMFLFKVLGDVSNSLNWMTKLSFYGYYEPRLIVEGEGGAWMGCLVLLGCAVVSGFVAHRIATSRRSA